VPEGLAGHTMLDFQVETVVTEDETIDWKQLREQFQPTGASTETTEAIWNNFVAEFGNTWRDYHKALVDSANYLSTVDKYVYSLQELLGYEMLQAYGTNPRAP
jgi:hypothetical protein